MNNNGFIFHFVKLPWDKFHLSLIFINSLEVLEFKPPLRWRISCAEKMYSTMTITKLWHLNSCHKYYINSSNKKDHHIKDNDILGSTTKCPLVVFYILSNVCYSTHFVWGVTIETITYSIKATILWFLLELEVSCADL